MLNILKENNSTRKNIHMVREALENNISEFNNLNENLKVITRIDLNIASGILRAAKEYMISDIIFGWSDKTTTSQRIFGTIFDHLFTGTQTLYALRVSDALTNYRNFVVCIPDNLEFESSFVPITSKLLALPKPDDRLLFKVKNSECIQKIKSLIPKKKKFTVDFCSDDIPEPINDSGTITILFLLRKQSVTYHARNNALVEKAMASNQIPNCIIVVPGFEN